MKVKRYWGIFVLIFILTGCTKQASVDRNLPIMSKQPGNDEYNEKESYPRVSEDTDVSPEIFDTNTFGDNSPCESISIVKEKGKSNKQFNIIMNNKEQFYLDLPEKEDPQRMEEILTADLDKDGLDEIITICDEGYYYAGIYIVNIASRSFMQIPYIEEGYYEVGIKYEMFAHDKKSVEIKYDEYEYDELISLPKDYTQFWDYYKAPKGTLIGYAGHVGFQAIQIVDSEGRKCLKMRQPIIGVESKQDWLGDMETIINWDEFGTYHIEKSNFILKK